jgi:zinc protease
MCALMAVASTALGQQTGGIPAHPRELKYAPLEYTPPKAASYRKVLANGVPGYFVEDHELPLVNVAVIIRTGSYLEPAGKEGLASATGSQVRAGGTAKRKAEDFD